MPFEMPIHSKMDCYLDALFGHMKSARSLVPALLSAATVCLVGCGSTNGPQPGNRVQPTSECDALSNYQSLKDRFNRRLSGRYPFGALAAPDADQADVKAFFAEYAAHGAALHFALGLTKAPCAANALEFLEQLGKIAMFLSSNLLSGEPGQPLTLLPTFHPMPAVSSGGEHVVEWTLSAGQQASSFPGRAGSRLEWSFGQPIALDLVWATDSGWRPAMPRPVASPDFTVAGKTASFTATGAWALLRFIDAHRSGFTNDTGAQDLRRVILEFSVPMRRSVNHTVGGEGDSKAARLHLGLTLVAMDPKSKISTTLVWPGGVMRSAP